MNLKEAKQQVGKGWHKLLKRAYKAKPEGTEITGVKEKWGSLRIDADYVTDEYSDFLWDLENESTTVCEVCGKPGTTVGGGWVKTLCAKHAAERK